MGPCSDTGTESSYTDSRKESFVRALVTGGAGFLGSHLVEHLLEAGFEVDVLDDLSHGHLGNLESAFPNSGFRFHLGSVLDRNLVRTLVEKADIVYHLAALVGIPVLLDARKEILRVNAHGSYRVMEACADLHRRCVFFSSSEVYGNGKGKAFTEDDPLEPECRGSVRWRYAVAKICSERAAMFLSREKGFPVTVMRPFNAVGPRQSIASGLVLPAFVRAAIRGEPLIVFGTGEQSRTFVAGTDLIEQIVRLSMDERTVGGTFNVGGEEEYSIAALAQKVKSVLGSSSEIRFTPFEEVYGPGNSDLVQRKPDLSRLKSLGHFRPLRPLPEVILETASQHRAELREDRAG
jgi:UDP-glucose 4-epimerase